MAERDDHASLEEPVDQRVGAGKLGSERHQPHRPAVEQQVEQREVGIASRRRHVRSETLRREERTLEVDAEDPGTAGVALGDLAHRGEQLVLRRGDQSRQVRGDARLEQRLARAPVAVGVGVEEIDATEAVHLQIDEARDGEPPADGAAEADGEDPPLADLDVAGNEGPVDVRGFDTQSHRASLR